MRNISYIFIAFAIMAISAFSANAADKCDVGAISAYEETDLFAYNAVNETVEYLSEQNSYIVLVRNSSYSGVLRHLESKRHTSSIYRFCLLARRSKLLTLVQSAGFQTCSALCSGTRSTSELIYFIRTIII